MKYFYKAKRENRRNIRNHYIPVPILQQKYLCYPTDEEDGTSFGCALCANYLIFCRNLALIDSLLPIERYIISFLREQERIHHEERCNGINIEPALVAESDIQNLGAEDNHNGSGRSYKSDEEDEIESSVFEPIPNVSLFYRKDMTPSGLCRSVP